MPFIKYINKKFNASSKKIIDQANVIISSYKEQGYDLTLRQLYYQFVSRDLLDNTINEYKRLGNVINDARLTGYIDWYAIVDRTRHLRGITHWDSPQEIIESSAESYAIDKWEKQKYRIEVWIEKDALIGILNGVCSNYDVDYFSCRGYTSASEMWKASQRLANYTVDGQKPIILHLGDHDPSGVDMTRDIQDRLDLFTEVNMVDVQRIALNVDQIKKYNPPPNPAKLTDSRAREYVKRYGPNSWELDALEPSVLEKLIEKHILKLRNEKLWSEAVAVEDKHKDILHGAARLMADQLEGDE